MYQSIRLLNICHNLNSTIMTTDNTTGKFLLAPLPYDMQALAPHISEETLLYHHDSKWMWLCEWAGRRVEAAYPQKHVERVGVDLHIRPDFMMKELRYTRVLDPADVKADEVERWLIDQADYAIIYMQPLLCMGVRRLRTYHYAQEKLGDRCINLCSAATVQRIWEQAAHLPKWQKTAMEGLLMRTPKKELARQSLRRMDMERLSGRCYRELSGGQQQRVLLARALCAAQKMLLLDEPVSGLDPSASRELYQVISQLNKHDGVTILMISHDVQAALCHASHILCLGEQVFFGPRDAFVRSAPGQRYLKQRGGVCLGGAD